MLDRYSKARLGTACAALALCMMLSACGAPRDVVSVKSETVATLAAPWSMAFLPDGRMLVTERPPSPTPTLPGALRLVTSSGSVSPPIAGLPANVGLLDIKLDPRYSSNHLIYVSYLESDPSAARIGRNAADTGAEPAGLAVVRGKLALSIGAAKLSGATVIWRQTPKIVSSPGTGEPGGRMVFSPTSDHLFIAAGDRQELDARILFELDNTLGKTVRIHADGSIPDDNPFTGVKGARGEIWSLGHRNAYGLVFKAGRLWEHEMGPLGGDELNLIDRGNNYGWPVLSYGNHYDGGKILKPKDGDGSAKAVLWWTPAIAPSDMIIYSGSLFEGWRGEAIVSGLQSMALIRVHLAGSTAREVQRIAMHQRIRSVQEGPDGALWVLEDQPTGKLRKLTPIFAQ